MQTIMIYPKSYVVYDFETTGLDTSTCDVIEIGALLVEPGTEPVIKSWLIKNSNPLPEKIVQITGITDDLLSKDGIPELQAFTEFAEFVKGRTLIGYNNIQYDNKILSRKIQKLFSKPVNPSEVPLEQFDRMEDGIDHLDALYILGGLHRTFDVAVLYKAHLEGIQRHWYESFEEFAARVMSFRFFNKWNLGLAYKTLFPDNPSLEAHRASGDVQMTHKVFQSMIANTNVELKQAA